ncbi:hypothetical protein ACH5RR_006478 [Cinchona calisaya]|uniref:Uncharacterized protein n=1 Tax=Cinchona calisaya TaxID=153742 RepID=A0ABD3AP42_9GENT
MASLQVGVVKTFTERQREWLSLLMGYKVSIRRIYLTDYEYEIISKYEACEKLDYHICSFNNLEGVWEIAPWEFACWKVLEQKFLERLKEHYFKGKEEDIPAHQRNTTVSISVPCILNMADPSLIENYRILHEFDKHGHAIKEMKLAASVAAEEDEADALRDVQRFLGRRGRRGRR